MTAETLPTTSYGKGFAVITQELFVRRIMRMPVVENARLISEHYNGMIAVPLPEIDAAERPAAANLIAQNIDQHAMRVASTQPTVTVAPIDPSKKKALDTARLQKRALLSWDDDDQRELFDRRRARWLAAWAEAPVIIRPDPKLRRPVWELRNPLGCYPNPLRRYDDMRPLDVISTYVRTYQWLKNAYPALDQVINGARKEKYLPDARFECIEYVDDEVIVMGILGVGEMPPFELLGALGFAAFPVPATSKGQTYAIELERTPNLTGTCTAVTPGRITLDMPKGLADDQVGIFQMQAKMMALHVNAVARAIYPNDWFVETQTGGEIVTQADGLRGITGHVRGGQILQLSAQPGVQTMPMIDQLGDNARVAGAVPMEWSGNSPTNVRTAARGLSVMSGAVDFYIQEHQQIIARAKQHEYDIAVEVDKAYFKNDKKTFYVSFGPNNGEQTYVPKELWATHPKIKVRYNYAGMDAGSIANVIGMKLGEGTLSRETAMQYDPSIDDVEAERGRVTADHLEDALLASVSQQAQAGAISPTDVAQIVLYVSSGDYTLAEAVNKVHEEAQVRQASSGAQGTPEGPAQPGSPQAQVGLQGGPQGAAQPVIQGPNQSQVNLRQLVANMAGGGR